MALIAYGGAGPTHCCGFLKGLSFGLNLTSSFSSVFSAFGSSRTDLVHSYVKSVKIPLVDDGRYLDDFNQFNEVVKEGIRLAGRDVQSEGYSPEEANYYLDLTGTGDSMGVRVTVHQLYMESQDDLQRVCQAFRDMGSPNGQKIVIGTIVLNALIKMPRHELKKQKPSGKDPGHALKTNREILWSSEIGYKKTPIYDSALLIAGNVVEGPAVVEAKDTNYVIPINWSFLVDEYANVVIKEGT
jgi:N-methylhydantoinase A